MRCRWQAWSLTSTSPNMSVAYRPGLRRPSWPSRTFETIVPVLFFWYLGWDKGVLGRKQGITKSRTAGTSTSREGLAPTPWYRFIRFHRYVTNITVGPYLKFHCWEYQSSVHFHNPSYYWLHLKSVPKSITISKNIMQQKHAVTNMQQKYMQILLWTAVMVLLNRII